MPNTVRKVKKKKVKEVRGAFYEGSVDLDFDQLGDSPIGGSKL